MFRYSVLRFQLTTFCVIPHRRALGDGTLKPDQSLTGTWIVGDDGRGTITLSDSQRWSFDVLSPMKFVATPTTSGGTNSTVLILEK